MVGVMQGFDVRGRPLHPGELAAWLSEHSLGSRFGLGVVDTGQGHRSMATGLAIVAADGDARHIDPADLIPEDNAALASWLADPGPPKAVHDVKRASHAVASQGWTLRGVTSDTTLAAFLLEPGRRVQHLNDLLIRHMRCALPAEALHSPRPDAVILRTCAVLDLADTLDEDLARTDSSALLDRLEIPLSRVLTLMETTGFAVDRGLVPDPSTVSVSGRIHPVFHRITTAAGRLRPSAPAGAELDLAGLRDAVRAGEDYRELLVVRFAHLAARIAVDLPEALDRARALGFATTWSGRRRYVSGLDSADPQTLETAEKVVKAFILAGSAADLIASAMIAVNAAIDSAAMESRLVLQWDDELVLEVADGERDGLVELLGNCLAHIEPLEVGLGCGPTWAAARRLS